jgi:hypothetical protein
MRQRQRNGGIISYGLRTFQRETPLGRVAPPINRDRFANHPMIEKSCRSTDRCFGDGSRRNPEQGCGGMPRKDADGWEYYRTVDT